jgi:hypothetical protein
MRRRDVRLSAGRERSALNAGIRSLIRRNMLRWLSVARNRQLAAMSVIYANARAAYLEGTEALNGSSEHAGQRISMRAGNALISHPHQCKAPRPRDLGTPCPPPTSAPAPSPQAVSPPRADASVRYLACPAGLPGTQQH